MLSISSDAQFEPESDDANRTEDNPAKDKTQIEQSAQNISRSWRKDECDFKGRRLKIAVTPQPPFVNCFQNYYGEWMCNGSNIEVISVLEQRLNFQAEWLVLSNNHLDKSLPLIRKMQQDQVLPPQSSALNYTGILNLVVSGRAWLSANGIVSSQEREKNLLLSKPFDAFKLHLLLSKSVRDHDHIFVKPFNPNAWAAIFVSALAIVPVFYLINSTSSHYHLRDDKFLSHITLFQCFQHHINSMRQWKIRKAFKNIVKLDMKRLSSTDEEEDEFYKMARSDNVFSLVSMNRAPIEAKRRKQMLVERRRQVRRLLRNKHQTGFFRMAYVAWYIIGSLAAQGGETEDLPHASSTRILVAFWWLYLIVISSIHSGILTAILTFPKQNDFIQTLDDFLALNQGKEKMKLTVDKHSELAYYLSNPDNLHKSPMQDLFKVAEMEQQNAKQELVKGPIVEVDFQRHRQRVLDDVLRGQGAYLDEKSTINMIISQEYFEHKPLKCQFKSSRFAIDTVPMSLVLSPRLSNLCVRSINALLRFIMLTGLAQKWRRKYEVLGNDCLETVIINAGDVDKIGLRHVELGFWLLSAGLACGFFFLVFEVIWLLTTDDDDDDSDDSSESSSSSDSDSSGLKFGHRVSQMTQRSLRSLKVKLKPETGKSASKQRLPALPPLPSLELPEMDLELTSDLEPATSQQQQRRKRRASIRAAERRARRLKRTLELVKKLHEGKVYSDFFMKVSDQVQSRARRASQAITSRLTTATQNIISPQFPVARTSKVEQEKGVVRKRGSSRSRSRVEAHLAIRRQRLAGVS